MRSVIVRRLAISLVALFVASCVGPSTHVPPPTQRGISARGLAYAVSGNGPAVVLIHGFQTDLREWDEVVPLLEREFRIIRYDLRGHGSSGRADSAFHPHEELAALLDELRLPRARLVGLSAGATVALDLATALPARVDRLVLVSPGLPEIPVTASREWMRPIGEALRAGSPQRAAELWWESPIMAGTRARGDSAMRYRTVVLSNASVWTQNAAAAQRPRPLAGDRLGQLRAPLLVVTGERDETGARAQADSIRSRAPGTMHRELAGAGHMISTERPRELAELLRSFLAGSAAHGTHRSRALLMYSWPSAHVTVHAP